MNFRFLVLILLCAQLALSQSTNFNNLRANFAKGYSALQLPNLQISYTQNLNAIKSPQELQDQEAFFKSFQKRLSTVALGGLDEYQRLDFYIMTYETELNLQRIILEKQWDHDTQLDDSKSIFTIQNGKDWYAYLLKRWVDINVSPDKLFEFGLTEIEKVKSNMIRIQEASGLSKSDFKKHLNDETFFYNHPDDVKAAFIRIKKEVMAEANNMFPYIYDIPEVNIERGENSSMSQVPAYYNNNTFYFNFFDTSFQKRQLGWFYAHEAIPGHHYQAAVNSIVKRTEIQDLFWYAGFVEGWGAYVEYLGYDLGVYKTIYDEYGKWEWDLIRSVRVSLDVGINYYGWSDEKALAFWKQHIKDQDDIGVREINRMKRWPAQVVTYKYGADVMLKLLSEAKRNQNFEYKAFHKELLKYGDIPISVLLSI